MTRKIRVASVQFESKADDKEANFARMERFLARAVEQEVRMVIFPECCVTGYWFIRNLSKAQLAKLAEPIPDGPSTQRLRQLAKRHGMTIGAGWLETGDHGHFYNSYVVAMPDETVQRHRKLHAFEHECVVSGSEYTVFFSNGGGVDDDEIRTGNAMILAPYGRVLAETWKAEDALVIADLDATLLKRATGREWIQARRPELYTPLTVPTGLERDVHQLKFEE